MKANGKPRPPGMLPLDRDLLAAAKALVADGHPASAVVAAHAATEVVAELVIGALLELHGVRPLEPHLKVLARSFHLTNDGVRGIYETLADDRLGASDLWQRYKEHTKRRHGAAHGGEAISIEAAEDSIDVCDRLVRHLLSAWFKADERLAASP